MKNLEQNIHIAIEQFWRTRKEQRDKQISSGRTDAGHRSSVTGGKQMNGFERIAREIAVNAGISEASIFQSKSITLPGFYRPTKDWDFLVVDNGTLIAAIEFKSQVGPSFGNNFNNRLEESIGTATDLWTAYRDGIFGEQMRPWLGYLFVLEDCIKSQRPVGVAEPHFNVFPEFKGASYAKRYELLLLKLLRERLYDGCALILTQEDPLQFRECLQELTMLRFFIQFESHLKAYITERNS